MTLSLKKKKTKPSGSTFSIILNNENDVITSLCGGIIQLSVI